MTPDARQRSATSDPLTWIVAGLLALPLVVAAIGDLRSGIVTSSDWALLELRVRDVGGPDTPLVGPYSRYGWYHPGPLLFWALAPIYRLAGSSGGALYAAAAAINVVAVAAFAVLAHRLGGRRLLVTAGVAAGLLLAAGGSTLADPWNPYITVLPLAVFLLAAALTARGDLAGVPVAVVAGSFVVQSHVGNAVVVTAVATVAFVAGVVALVRSVRRGEGPSTATWWVTGSLTVLLAVGAWTAPLVQQASGDVGNLGQIVAYFTDAEPDEAPGGVAAAITVAGRELAPWGPWVGGPEPTDIRGVLDPTTGWSALPLFVGLAAAGIVSWRRRDVRACALVGVAAVAAVASVFAASRITGLTYAYLVRPWWAVALVGWVAVVWVAVRTVPLPGPLGSSPRLAASVAVGLVALGSAVAVVEVAPGRPAEPATQAAVAITDDVRAAVEAAVRAAGGDGTSSTGALYVTPEGRSLGESLAAVINALTADGHEVATSAWFVTEYGERRVVGGPGTPARFDAVVIVATSEAAERRLDAGERPVAEWDPLDATERAEARRLMRGLATAFRAAGRADLADAAERHRLHEALAADDPLPLPGVSTADVERLTELELRGIRVAVFIDPTPRNAADIVAEGARIPDVWP